METFLLTLAAIAVALTSQTFFATAAQPVDACVEIVADGSGPLVNSHGAVGIAPVAATAGNVRGTLTSVVQSYDASMATSDDTRHLTLIHTFSSVEAGRPGTLTLKDRALCAPAGSGPAVCRSSSNALTIVSGTGIFSNAAGSIRNAGAIDFTAYNLTFSIRGRVCADQL